MFPPDAQLTRDDTCLPGCAGSRVHPGAGAPLLVRDPGGTQISRSRLPPV